MATITKRASGLWQAKIRVKGQPATSRSFTYKSDADAWAKEVESAMRRGIYLPRKVAEETTFEELVKRFEAEFAPHHYRGKGWQHKLKPLRGYFGKYALAVITPALVAKYRDQRLADPDPRYKDPTKAPRVSGATVKTEIDLLSKILDVGQKEFEISLPLNPVQAIRKPKDSKGRDRRLSVEEAEVLFRECEASGNPQLLPAVRLAIETAMRQGELLNLTWRDIDWKRGIALLLDPDKLKTEEARAVPLTSAALEVLRELKSRLVVHSITGRVIPTDRMTLYKAFKRAAARAGLEDLRWHDLRHESVSRFAERGDLSDLELMGISGHKTARMLKRYAHLRAEHLAKKLG